MKRKHPEKTKFIQIGITEINQARKKFMEALDDNDPTKPVVFPIDEKVALEIAQDPVILATTLSLHASQRSFELLGKDQTTQQQQIQAHVALMNNMREQRIGNIIDKSDTPFNQIMATIGISIQALRKAIVNRLG